MNQPSTSNLNQIPRQFPSKPINIQPRQIPQRFFTNKQVFGRNTNTNVWKPQPNFFPTHAPTLMSTNTRNIPQRNIPKHKYTAEELHHLENPHDEYSQEYYTSNNPYDESDSNNYDYQYDLSEMFDETDPYYASTSLNPDYSTPFVETGDLKKPEDSNFYETQPIIEET